VAQDKNKGAMINKASRAMQNQGVTSEKNFQTGLNTQNRPLGGKKKDVKRVIGIRKATQKKFPKKESPKSE